MGHTAVRGARNACDIKSIVVYKEIATQNFIPQPFRDLFWWCSFLRKTLWQRAVAFSVSGFLI